MKTVFKIVLFAALAAAAPARADRVFWTPRDLLADAFRSSATVGYRVFDLTPEQRARVEARLGYRLPRARYTIFVAQSGEHVDGYALIDDEPGEHMPITFAVKISPDGVVERQEIVAYREARGDEVRDERFKRQFVGKTSRDPVRAGEDIAAVSGATISSRAMANGVRRALVLVDELLLRPKQAATVRASR
jgi:hypothetical protein